MHNVFAVYGFCAVQRGISWVHWRVFSTPGDIMINMGEDHWENNGICMDTPVYCIEHPPVYSWYPPTLVMVPPSVLMVSSGVLNAPRWTHGIPRCTEHPHCAAYPPVYCTGIMQGVSMDVLVNKSLVWMKFLAPFNKCHGFLFTCQSGTRDRWLNVPSEGREIELTLLS